MEVGCPMNKTQENWDHLLVLLEDMRVVYQEFRDLLCAEERMLLGMDRLGVAGVTEKKEQVLGVMCRYEQQVIGLLQQLSGFTHQGPFGAWLQEVRQPQALSANSILQELCRLTEIIQEQGKKNDTLTRRTQHIVREAIHLIYTGLGNGPTYQGSGALSSPSVLNTVHLHG